jgi:hypothetical protein
MVFDSRWIALHYERRSDLALATARERKIENDYVAALHSR